VVLIGGSGRPGAPDGDAAVLVAAMRASRNPWRRVRVAVTQRIRRRPDHVT